MTGVEPASRSLLSDWTRRSHVSAVTAARALYRALLSVTATVRQRYIPKLLARPCGEISISLSGHVPTPDPVPVSAPVPVGCQTCECPYTATAGGSSSWPTFRVSGARP